MIGAKKYNKKIGYWADFIGKFYKFIFPNAFYFFLQCHNSLISLSLYFS
jgi:hypothetical protein